MAACFLKNSRGKTNIEEQEVLILSGTEHMFFPLTSSGVLSTSENQGHGDSDKTFLKGRERGVVSEEMY